MKGNSVVSKGKLYKLQEEPYWHLAHPTAGFLLNNVALSEGICWSISAINRMPGLMNAMSPYTWRIMNDRKEQVWERIRTEVNPELPSRKGAIFLFDREDLILDIMSKWFPTEMRHLLDVRVVSGGKMHRGDSKWLDCAEDLWEKNAYQYWSGGLMDNPVPEVLIEGAVYFPGWKRPPFAVGEGLPK